MTRIRIFLDTHPNLKGSRFQRTKLYATLGQHASRRGGFMITLPTKPTRVEPVSSLTRFGGRILAQTGRLFVEKDAPYNLHLSFEP